MRPGFADPVLGTQAGFRQMLDAMARPGRVETLRLLPDAPPPLHPAAAAVLLTLADAETPVWTDAPGPARDWLAFHCGAAFVDRPEEAAFLLSTGPMPRLASLAAGSDEAPQEGATLIQQVAALRAGEGWVLRGPGIRDRHRLHVAGLPGDFLAQWQENAARFPRGLDVFLAAGTALAALPRTLSITEPG